jgi:hypothetical protein
LLLTFIAHLFVVKLFRKFSTQKDYPLEFPVVTTSVTKEEYLDPVEEHLDNKPVNTPTIQTVAKVQQPILTFGIAITFINKFLIKTGSKIEAIAFLIQNNDRPVKSLFIRFYHF